MNLVEWYRYGKYRFKYVYGRSLGLKTPVDVSLELSSHCNMKCEYCYHSDPNGLPFTKGFMTWETAEQIITQAKGLEVPALKFNWKGESTVNPIFPRVTKLAKSLARGYTFQDRLTNSNFKFQTDKEEIFEGLCNQTKVKVSYDSFRKEVFESQRRGGDHEITTRNIEKFYHYPLRKNTELVIQAVRTNLNKDEDIEAEAKKRWPSATISIRDMVAGRVEKDLSQFENKTRDCSDRQSCVQAHVRLIFNWEGRAFPCCPDVGEKLVLGDINRQSIYEIFNSSRAQFLRKRLLNKKQFESNPCAGCSSFESYKGFKPVWNS
jgi:radical SAM protein with 4Fe4S-binding SPASM domain